MRTERLPALAQPIADAFRRDEPTTQWPPGTSTEAAVVTYTLRFLAEPGNDGTAETMEDIERVRTWREVRAA